jgi:hypothetical protein
MIIIDLIVNKKKISSQICEYIYTYLINVTTWTLHFIWDLWLGLREVKSPSKSEIPILPKKFMASAKELICMKSLYKYLSSSRLFNQIKSLYILLAIHD